MIISLLSFFLGTNIFYIYKIQRIKFVLIINFIQVPNRILQLLENKYLNIILNSYQANAPESELNLLISRAQMNP
jgi:hypothetical protein